MDRINDCHTVEYPDGTTDSFFDWLVSKIGKVKKRIREKITQRFEEK